MDFAGLDGFPSVVGVGEFSAEDGLPWFCDATTGDPSAGAEGSADGGFPGGGGAEIGAGWGGAPAAGLTLRSGGGNDSWMRSGEEPSTAK